MFLFFESFFYLSLSVPPPFYCIMRLFPLIFPTRKRKSIYRNLRLFVQSKKKNKIENGGRGVSPSRGPQGFKPLAATSSALATRASTAAARSLSTPNGSATVTGRPEAAAASAARAGMSSRTCLPRERK